MTTDPHTDWGITPADQILLAFDIAWTPMFRTGPYGVHSVQHGPTP
jgi:hypothetical protein